MTVRIGIGPSFGVQLSPGDYWRWIDCCEASGIDSIWHSDRMIGPALEPVTLMAALAARTRKMRFGISALVAPLRDPVVLAKEFATIDFLSEGRLLPVFGVGFGHDPYWEATGASPKERGAKSNEFIQLLRQLLEQDDIAFAGRHYTYHGPGVWPSPAKRIPLWIGGGSPAALRRTAQLGDGWLGSLCGPDAARAAKQAIAGELAACGRSIDDDHYGVTVTARIGSPDDPAADAARKRLSERIAKSAQDAVMIGDASEVIERLRAYVAAGMSKFVLIPVASDSADLIRQTEMLAGSVLPAVEDRA